MRQRARARAICGSALRHPLRSADRTDDSRMTPSALALIGVTIIVSSFISGVFGMAGGMILLGVLLDLFRRRHRR